MRVVRLCVLCAALTQMESKFNDCSGADAVLQNGSRVEDVSKMVEGSNQFALELYQQLHSSEGNLFFSPSSISTALSMTYAGAAGETKTEMAKTLRIPLPDDRLHSAMKRLQASWKSPAQSKGIRLNMANRHRAHVSHDRGIQSAARLSRRSSIHIHDSRQSKRCDPVCGQDRESFEVTASSKVAAVMERQ